MDENADKDKKNKPKDYIQNKDLSNIIDNTNQNIESKKFKNWLVNENKRLYGHSKTVPKLFQPLKEDDKNDLDKYQENYYTYETSDISFVNFI